METPGFAQLPPSPRGQQERQLESPPSPSWTSPKKNFMDERVLDLPHSTTTTTTSNRQSLVIAVLAIALVIVVIASLGLGLGLGLGIVPGCSLRGSSSVQLESSSGQESSAVFTVDEGRREIAAGIKENCPLPPPVKTDKSCTFAIVGGGIGGALMFAHLAPKYGSGLCLFEATDYLGGRLHDFPVEMNGQKTFIPGGGMRIIAFYNDPNEPNNRLWNLAKKLGIKLAPVERTTYTWGRNQWWKTAEDAAKSGSYVGLPFPNGGESVWGGQTDTENILWEKLCYGNNGYGKIMDNPPRQYAEKYYSYPMWVADSLGGSLGGIQTAELAQAGYSARDYLGEFMGFSDFNFGDVDPKAYMDYTCEEYDYYGTVYYPENGMSDFVKKLIDIGQKQKGRVFKSTPIVSIESTGVSSLVLQTAQKVAYLTTGATLALAPSDLPAIGGELMVKLRASEEFQAMRCVPVVTVGVLWGSPFWMKTGFVGAEPRTRIRHRHSCITMSEFSWTGMSTFDFGFQRVVYSDDPGCISFWIECAKTPGCLLPTLRLALTSVWPEGVKELPTLKIEQVKVFSHPCAWSYLKSGSAQKMISIDHISEWAISPMGQSVPLSLVGTEWRPHRVGWIDGAYYQASLTLQAKWGIDTLPLYLPDPRYNKRAARKRSVAALSKDGVYHHSWGR